MRQFHITCRDVYSSFSSNTCNHFLQGFIDEKSVKKKRGQTAICSTVECGTCFQNKGLVWWIRPLGWMCAAFTSPRDLFSVFLLLCLSLVSHHCLSGEIHPSQNWILSLSIVFLSLLFLLLKILKARSTALFHSLFLMHSLCRHTIIYQTGAPARKRSVLVIWGHLSWKWWNAPLHVLHLSG